MLHLKKILFLAFLEKRLIKFNNFYMSANNTLTHTTVTHFFILINWETEPQRIIIKSLVIFYFVYKTSLIYFCLINFWESFKIQFLIYWFLCPSGFIRSLWQKRWSELYQNYLYLFFPSLCQGFLYRFLSKYY